MLCNCDEDKVSPEAIVAGANRYGIENPCPIINRRIGLYGSTDDVEKEFKKLAAKYNEQYPGLKIDADLLPANDLKLQDR